MCNKSTFCFICCCIVFCLLVLIFIWEANERQIVRKPEAVCLVYQCTKLIQLYERSRNSMHQEKSIPTPFLVRLACEPGLIFLAVDKLIISFLCLSHPTYHFTGPHSLLSVHTGKMNVHSQRQRFILFLSLTIKYLKKILFHLKKSEFSCFLNFVILSGKRYSLFPNE